MDSQRETCSDSIAVIGLTYPFRGGISHYSSLLVRALRQRYDVAFLTLKRQYPKLLFPGVSQYDYSDHAMSEPGEAIIDSMNPLSWIRTARELKRLRPRLIVFQWWHPFFCFSFGSIVRLLDRELQSRVCFLCHNVLPHESSPLHEFLTRIAFGKVTKFIVHSSSDEEDLLSIKPAAMIRKGHHPTYSQFGSLSSVSRQEARETLGLEENGKVLLFFGLVRKYKGLMHLIEAMSLIPGKLDCQLVVAGEFYDDKQPYIDKIREYALEDRIKVVDEYIPNEQVATYFQAANVVVLPYVSATQSGIVQIAFGLNVPVITTNVGGLPEVVDDGETGYVVDAESPTSIAEAIQRYFDGGDEDRFRKNIEAQTSRFEWDTEVALIEEFL